MAEQINGANFRIAIIGTGFGGIGMAIRLKNAGFDDVTIFEKAGEVGGTWRENSYPGAACDIPSHLYSFSFEPKTDWSRRFAPQAEILGYLRGCADKHSLRSRIRFNTEIAGADYDDARALWRIRTTAGETFEANLLITACGQLNRPLTPKIPGAASFAGAQFHSARWDHGFDFAGKRVAVIGTGASAIQFVPELVKQAARLSLFQRSAPYVISKPDRAYSAFEHRLFARLPALVALDRIRIYWMNEVRALGFTRYKQLMKVMELDFRRLLKRQVKDAALRARLTPDYPMGCKRILISNDYYAALVQPNVELISDDIREITARGVVTADGREHAVDAIVYGTGFAATDFLAPMAIRGRGGLDLNAAWRDGAEAYLGMSVAGFPNLLMLYGPNTNLGHNSIIHMLESQFAYVLDALRQLRERRLQSLDVKPDVQSAFNANLAERVKRTVWDQGCTSWYKTASGRNTVNWPGFTYDYRARTKRLRLDEYRLTEASGAQA